jgi:ABC-type sugar transport system ATPase subunit
MTTPAASARGIAKSFGATRALDHVDFDVMPEKSRAGRREWRRQVDAGRILSGVHRPDAGEIAVDGRSCQFGNPHDAIVVGIATIPQELRLIPALSVAENLTLDDPPVRAVLGVLCSIARRCGSRRGRRWRSSTLPPIPTPASTA